MPTIVNLSKYIFSIAIEPTEISFPSLQRNEIKLSRGRVEEDDLGHGPQIVYKIRNVGLYVVVESEIGMAVMWDRKTAVRILLEPTHSVSHSNCYIKFLH